MRLSWKQVAQTCSLGLRFSDRVASSARRGGRYPRAPSRPGSGLIWNGIPYEPPVIPAKAGIQSVDSAFRKVRGMDSRLRGNDEGFEYSCRANDTTTPGHAGWTLSEFLE